jgi:hypothetical protein
MDKKEKTIIIASIIVTALSGFLHYSHANTVLVLP